MTYLQLINSAYRRRGILTRAGGVVNASQQAEGLFYLNAILDGWQALKRYAWTESFTPYTITPNHQPTLIGPGLSSPDFATVNNLPRPIRIIGADLIINSSNPSTDLPINIRDAAWWLANQVKAITSTVPTDLYYSPDWPNGKIYLWPVPTFAYGLRIEALIAPGAVATVSTTFFLPVAYWKALELTLSEELPAGPGDPPMPAQLPDLARRARAALESNNMTSPRIASADYGAGLGRGRRGFNWISGLPSGYPGGR